MNDRTLRQWGAFLGPCALLVLGAAAAIVAHRVARRERVAATLLGVAWLAAVGWALAGWGPVVVRAL